jgi:hypothetical protein
MNARPNPITGDSLPDTAANEATPAPTREAARVPPHSAWIAPAVLIAAWGVPGLGHALQRRWGRALGFFLAVAGLALTGYWLRGEVFGPRAHESFGTLGFVADAASGVFYFLAHSIEHSGPDISRATGNYGTRFIAAAGLVNLIAVIDAVETAIGRRG